jgi:hypothetical protein
MNLLPSCPAPVTHGKIDLATVEAITPRLLLIVATDQAHLNHSALKKYLIPISYRSPADTRVDNV